MHLLFLPLQMLFKVTLRLVRWSGVVLKFEWCCEHQQEMIFCWKIVLTQKRIFCNIYLPAEMCLLNFVFIQDIFDDILCCRQFLNILAKLNFIFQTQNQQAIWARQNLTEQVCIQMIGLHNSFTPKPDHSFLSLMTVSPIFSTLFACERATSKSCLYTFLSCWLMKYAQHNQQT